MGRLSKLPKFLEAMKKVLKDEKTVVLTDKELWVLVNENLSKKDRVGLSTFELWKTPTPNEKSPESQMFLDEDIIDEFRHTLAYARVKQKMDLGGNVLDKENKNQWGSTWMLERKFEDMKLKQNNTIELNHNRTIQIQVASEEQKKLIEGLRGENTIEMDYEEVNDEPNQIEE